MTKAQNSKGEYEIATAYKTGLAMTRLRRVNGEMVGPPTTTPAYDVQGQAFGGRPYFAQKGYAGQAVGWYGQ